VSVDRDVVVSGAATGFLNQVTIGAHAFAADEPESAGGHDLGPSPFELVCVALGVCTSMTVSMYARSRQMPLEHVTVRLRHARIEDGARHNHIDRLVELHGALTDEQRAKLLEIANKGPVHKAYAEGIDVTTTLAD
jgi:putative redox protein